MNRIKSDYAYIIAILMAFLSLKQAYKFAENDDLKFLLAPTNYFIKSFIGSSPTYSNVIGYHYNDLNITIEKSCSGYNFWILCFATTAILAVPYFHSIQKKIAAILLVLPLCWLLTIFANTSRISIAIFIAKIFPESARISWLHQAEGIFIYVSLLITFYLIFRHLLTKFYSKNAKLT